MTLEIPPEVAEQLGHYVYLYVDPRNEKPFYVGKGQNKRIQVHLSSVSASRKSQKIKELQDAGYMPRLEVLAHKLPDEETAYRIEAAVIDLFNLENELTNEVRGWKSVELDRLTISELLTYYAAPAVSIDEPSLLIRVNKLYRHNMPEKNLYEITRGVWKLSDRCKHARYALAVFHGIVREVYEIETWHKAGTTPYETRENMESRASDRLEFSGRIAPEEIRAKYKNKSVADYFKKGAQSPVLYHLC